MRASLLLSSTLVILRRWRGVVLLLAVMAILDPVLAQTAADAPAATPTTAPHTGTDVRLIPLLLQGGPVIWVLIVVFIGELYLIVEGFLFQRIGKLAPRALLARLREAMVAGNYQEAWTICQTDRCFLSTVLTAGLEGIGRGRDAVEFAIEETALRESTILRTNITYLSVIGVVSPMIGLTGTVFGMILAFSKLGDSGISDPSGLAAAIGEVLVATMAGLIVAIPAFIFYYFLRARSQTAILRTEEEISRLVQDIPFEQLTGIRIGENFSPDTSALSRSGSLNRPAVSQKVQAANTTNCPSCQAPIAVGTSPCPNCGTVLDWAT